MFCQHFKRLMWYFTLLILSSAMRKIKRNVLFTKNISGKLFLTPIHNQELLLKNRRNYGDIFSIFQPKNCVWNPLVFSPIVGLSADLIFSLCFLFLEEAQSTEWIYFYFCLCFRVLPRVEITRSLPQNLTAALHFAKLSPGTYPPLPRLLFYSKEEPTLFTSNSYFGITENLYNIQSLARICLYMESGRLLPRAQLHVRLKDKENWVCSVRGKEGIAV